MESLWEFSLGGTAIKELPSSTIHLKQVMFGLSFKGCQLSSSSLTSMPRGNFIDLSDCNLSAIPSVIGHIPMAEMVFLYLSGNDFVSLPESIFQFSSGLSCLYLDGCKSLRSLSNIQIPSTVCFMCVDNCTSLERLPEGLNELERLPERPYVSTDSTASLIVQCFNCFKLAENFEYISNMFQVSLSLISVCVF